MSGSKNYGAFMQWNTIGMAAERRKELLHFAKSWIDLESITLSEISQAVKDKYRMISPVRGI